MAVNIIFSGMSGKHYQDNIFFKRQLSLVIIWHGRLKEVRRYRLN